MALPSTGSNLMHSIVANVAALAVAILFYLWRAHQQTRQRRQRLLRERVAHMLWVMAEQIEEPDPALSFHGHG